MIILIIIIAVVIGVLSVFIHGIVLGYRQAIKDPVEAKIYELNEQAAHLETLINRDYEIGVLLNKALKTATGKQRITILNQLTTLDNRTLKNTKKLQEIKAMIKELE